MDNFINFLKEYYYLIFLILAFLVLVLELIILLIRKKDPSVLSGINSVLPEFITEAEKKYGAGNGDHKLNFVFRLTYDYLLRVFNIKDPSAYTNYIRKVVESILSTPTKKGD